MKDFKLTISSLGYFIKLVTELLTSNQKIAYRVVIKQWRESRSLSVNALQHVIYDVLSKYLISKGRKDWDFDKTKFEMKNNFLGWEDTECTNVFTGEITIKSTLRHTSELDQSEAYFYTQQIIDFCESVGCEIKIPSKCDYRDLMERQNK